MIFNDLREYISTLERMGELKVIEGASRDLEIGAITELASFQPNCPAVLFDSIQGFQKGKRLFTNFLTNRIRERLVFGVSNDLSDPEAVMYWKEKLKEMKPLPPVEVDNGPVKENIVVENCHVKKGHGGIVFGSETSGGIRNVYVRNCLYDGTDIGIRIKSRRGRGGGVENVWIENIKMKNISWNAVILNMFYAVSASDVRSETSRLLRD